MKEDKIFFFKSLLFPLLILFSMWMVKFLEFIFNLNFVEFGVYPLKITGLLGTITAPFIHENFQHLISNSVPFFLLSLALFYFYKGIAGRVLTLIWIINGVCVWLSGREAYHIGASGVVYGLAAFLFFSGILRKDTRLAAITLVIAFFYGSMVWGIFPDFFPGKNISYESHLWGLLTGLVFAVYYRKSGPARPVYSWELEPEDSEENNEDDIPKNTLLKDE